MSATSAAADGSDGRQPSILTILSGAVFVRHGSAPIAAAADGELLAVGDLVQTAADSHAIVTMFEGSTIEIEPSTVITIDDASRRETSTLIQLTQFFGRTWHVVTHLLTPDSRYDVRTPAATASVRGTVFEVAVLNGDGVAQGTTSVTTLRGAVATSDRDGAHEVLVTPATTTTVAPGAAPTEPRPAPDVTHVVPVKGAGADAPGKTDASSTADASSKTDASSKADASGKADASSTVAVSSKSDDGKGGNDSSHSTSVIPERGATAARSESGGNARAEDNGKASAHASESSQRSGTVATGIDPQRHDPEIASQSGDRALRASVVPTFSLPALPAIVTEGPKTNANERAKTNSEESPKAVEKANTNEKPSGRETSPGRSPDRASQAATAEHHTEPAARARANDRDTSGDQGRRR